MPVRNEISATGRASQQLSAAVDIDKVEELAAQAMEPVGEQPAADASHENELTENFEENTEVAEILSRAPCAIPLPGKILLKKGLLVSDVPTGLPLNRDLGDLDIRIGDPTAPKLDLPPRRHSSNVESISKPYVRQVFTSTAAQPAIPAKRNGNRVPASKSGHEEDRVALIRAPRAETNLGKDPKSRNYIRGVLHTHPWSLRFGALSSLLLLINLPLAVASAFFLLASRQNPEIFTWVSGWMLAFPIALPVTGIGYMIWGMSGKCRICHQKLFAHKGALKHSMAHRIPGMGFVAPLCLHLLAFNWFRCSSCGSPIRLRK